ncbi:MAG TPA: 4Fe-4S dicluster domain-containing protein [Candidatus Altiarchaeales archaeon]|nr:4Fe-4S dicluster domain-containing protein [Candidatus Altiarchaeales archaeon]
MKVSHDICCYCGGCVGICPQNALELDERVLKVDKNKCVECGLCVKFCPVGALEGERK